MPAVPVLVISPDGFVGIAGTFALVFGIAYLFQLRSRRRSRRKHEGAAMTGTGTWEGRMDSEAINQFLGTEIGWLRSMFLDAGVPMRLELSTSGLKATVTSRVMAKGDALTWDAPWGDIVGAVAESVGRKQFGGKISTVPMTDVHLTIVGKSAERFLDSWGLLPEAGEETVAEDLDWEEFVQRSMAPQWHPGTALFTIRTSAPEGLVEAITRHARGTVPPKLR
jgi:hypothetical protein